VASRLQNDERAFRVANLIKARQIAKTTLYVTLRIAHRYSSREMQETGREKLLKVIETKSDTHGKPHPGKLSCESYKETAAIRHRDYQLHIARRA